MQTQQFDESLFTLPCEDFYIAVASNPSLLQKGYQIVYKYLSLSSLNREQTLLHLLSTKAPVLTLVTRTYPVVYADERLQLTNQEKLKTKEFLVLQILLKQLLAKQTLQQKPNKRLLTNYILFLIHFHNIEGFQGWVSFYEKLLEEMIKLNSPLIGFFLIEILKSSDDRVSVFSKHILRFVINNQSVLKISEQQSLEIIYYCIKSMGFMNGTQDEVLEEYYEPYEDKIVEYIKVGMKKSIKIMKYSLKILTVLVGEYEVQLQKDLIVQLKQCGKELVGEYLAGRISQQEKDQLQEDDDLQQEGISSVSIGSILYQLIELLETLLSCQQLKLSDYQLYLAICLPALLLTKNDYLAYSHSTQSYLADLQDQGEKTLRNKIVSFILQLYEGQYPSKSKAKFLNQLNNYTQLIHKSTNQQLFSQQLLTFYSTISFPIKIQLEHIPLFQQSILFLLYHLTEQILTLDPKNLQNNKQLFMKSLGLKMETSPIDPLIKVSCINLLNKLIKSMTKTVKQAYYTFMIQSLRKITDFQKQKGYLLGIFRGIAYVSNDAVITFCQQPTQNGIPVLILQHLSKYLLDPNTLQESVYLIMQFLVTLLKKASNSVQVLKSFISPQLQMHILSTFIHDGMISDVVIELLSQIGNEQLINFVYGQYLKGLAKQENLSTLISKWIALNKLKVQQNQIITIIALYKSPFVSKIVKQYLKLVKITNSSQSLSPPLIKTLNQNLHPSWVLLMLACNILQNPQSLLLTTIEKITNQLTSQYQIQCQLLLPYYTFINDPQFGIKLLKTKSPQLYEKFINKLISYAALFQGPHLKVITCHVLLNICQLDSTKLKPTVDLISSYGNTMEGQQWEDQHEKDEETVIDRMFNMKMTNDEVETDFAQVFGAKVFDMETVNEKATKFMAM